MASYAMWMLRYMSGGAETGFRRVQAKEYKPRLLHFCGVRRNVVVKEVSLFRLSGQLVLSLWLVGTVCGRWTI